MKWLAVLALNILMLVPLSGPAQAHALDPGYLSVQNISGEAWKVFWRKPNVKGKPMGIDARLPENCTPARGPEPRFDGRAWVSDWLAICPGGLSGGRIVIEGLRNTSTDTLIRIQGADISAQVMTVRATPDQPYFDVPENLSSAQVFFNYIALGFEHILDGIDHLLFVFALLVLIQTPWRLVGAITAFTVAHSITLAAATLGFITLPSPPVEAVIALSIVLLAVEILRRGRVKNQLAERFPWVVSFLFGLLHGLGFAGALSEIGLPPGDIPVALLAFNIGVEAGQLTFVFGVMVAYGAMRLIWPKVVNFLRAPGAPGTLVMGYGIGAVSVYWLVERVAVF